MTAMTVSSGIGVLLLLLRPADTLWQPHAVFSRSVPPRHCRTTARAASTITSGNNTMAAGCTDAPARAAAEAETIASRSPSVPPAREPRDPRPPLTLAWSLVDGDPRLAGAYVHHWDPAYDAGAGGFVADFERRKDAARAAYKAKKRAANGGGDDDDDATLGAGDVARQAVLEGAAARAGDAARAARRRNARDDDDDDDDDDDRSELR